MYYDFDNIDNILESFSGDYLSEEYSGKPEMNDRFKKALDDMVSYIDWLVNTTCPDILSLADRMLDKTEEIVNKVKKGDQDSDYYISELKIYLDSEINKYNSQCNSNSFKTTYKKNYMAFKEFRKLIKKFSVKYSTVTMEMKKEYDKIFSQYTTKLQSICKDWVRWEETDNPAKYAKMYQFNLFLGSVNPKAMYEVTGNYINPILSCVFNNVAGAGGMIQWTRYKLGIEKETSSLYRFIQKLFKNKPKNSEARFNYGFALEGFMYIDENVEDFLSDPIDYTVTLEEFEYEDFLPYYPEI